MAAVQSPEDRRLDKQRVREERMRYEMLYAIYYATDRLPCVRIDSIRFLSGLGVWREELDRVLHYLIEARFLTRDDKGLGDTADPGMVVCITQRGIDYIQRDARRRKTIRDDGRENGSA